MRLLAPSQTIAIAPLASRGPRSGGSDLLGGVFLGIFSGMLSGYIPGLHPNTFFSEFDPTYLDREDVLTFASACSAVNVPLSKVESMFLGVPDDQTSVAVLIPLQRYTIEGRTEEAARLVALGTLSTGFFATVTLPCIVKIVGPMYVISKPIIPWLVLAILVLQTYDNGLRGLAIFSASSVLGYVVLSGPLDVASPLEAMFSGFYAIGPGISCLINRTSIPKQRPGKPAILEKELPKCGILAAFAGCTLGFLPRLGPANVVSVLTRLGVDTTERYLLVTSGIDAADAVSSIVALHALGNPRSGPRCSSSGPLETSRTQKCWRRWVCTYSCRCWEYGCSSFRPGCWERCSPGHGRGY